LAGSAVRFGWCGQAIGFGWRFSGLKVQLGFFRLKVPLGDRRLRRHQRLEVGCWVGQGTVAQPVRHAGRAGHPQLSSLRRRPRAAAGCSCQRFPGPEALPCSSPLSWRQRPWANSVEESRPINSPPQSTGQHGRSAEAVQAAGDQAPGPSQQHQAPRRSSRAGQLGTNSGNPQHHQAGQRPGFRREVAKHGLR